MQTTNNSQQRTLVCPIIDSVEEKEAEAVFPPSLSEGRRMNKQGETIAAYFEDHSAFYDITSAEYKNRAKKNALLCEFGKSIWLDGEFRYIFFSVTLFFFVIYYVIVMLGYLSDYLSLSFCLQQRRLCSALPA